MDTKEFIDSCATVGALRFPRWEELPEFDLYMDQVIALAEKYLSALSPDNKELITPSMINNYVKSGILPAPKNKKYGRHQLALLIMICSTKSVLEISTISDIINESLKSNDMQKVFNNFAQMYEKALFKASQRAVEMALREEQENIFGDIAMENALNAGASRTLAMYAYTAIDKKEKDEPSKEDKKSEKKSKKTKKQPVAAEKGHSDTSGVQENQ